MAKYSSLTDKQVSDIKVSLSRYNINAEFSFLTEIDQALNNYHEQLEWRANGKLPSHEVKQLQKLKTKLKSSQTVPLSVSTKLSLRNDGYSISENLLAIENKIEELKAVPNDSQIFYSERDTLDINVASIIKRLTDKKPTATKYEFFSDVLCILFDCKDPHTRCEKALSYIS